MCPEGYRVTNSNGAISAGWLGHTEKSPAFSRVAAQQYIDFVADPDVASVIVPLGNVSYVEKEYKPPTR